MASPLTLGNLVGLSPLQLSELPAHLVWDREEKGV